MDRIGTDGVELAYERIGPKNGEIILAITGVIETLLHWHPGPCWRLAIAGYRTLRYDARDGGRSTWFDGSRYARTPEEKAMWADLLVVRGCNSDGVERHVLALRASSSYLDRLRMIRAPTTVIQADEDKDFSRAQGDDLAGRIPGA